VVLSIDDWVEGVPEDVGLAAYRIVQQALTNSLSHGGPGVSARVEVRGEGDHLVIDIVDDGGGVSSERGSGVRGAA
jgi:signal transduction histidine kinase